METAEQDYMNRPARKQAKARSGPPVMREDIGTYNIWYNKYSGETYHFGSVEKAKSRCNIARDAGRTRAKPGAYFCLHFARGACSRGHECYYFHRIPNDTDRFDLIYDCFGREKHKDERPDRSGVGSFEKDQRTLYIGRIFLAKDTEKIILKHFQEWGEVVQTRLLPSKSVGFVTYKNRYSAEFAKEAMHGQSLDHGEVINLRWAEDDPSPQVQIERKRTLEETVAKAALSKLPVLGEHGNYLEYESHYFNQDADSKRQKTDEDAPGDGAQYGTLEEYYQYYLECSQYYELQGDPENAALYKSYADYYNPEKQGDQQGEIPGGELPHQNGQAQQDENSQEPQESNNEAPAPALASIANYDSD